MVELQGRTHKTPTRIKNEVASILHESAEAFTIKLFTDALEAMLHAKQVAITPEDLQINIRLQGYKDKVLFGWKRLSLNKWLSRTCENLITE